MSRPPTPESPALASAPIVPAPLASPVGEAPACGVAPCGERRRPRGRPRAFDRDAALDAALALFWARGYSAVEVRDLVAAMGIHPPSFYAAFGSKAQLFEEAVARYEARILAPVRAALDAAPTAYAAVETLLTLTVDRATGGDAPGAGPRGCLLVVGGVNCPPADAAAACTLAARRAVGAAMLRERIARGVADGDLPADADVDALAAYVTTVVTGIALQARDGAPRPVLAQVAAAALRAFPAPVGR